MKLAKNSTVRVLTLCFVTALPHFAMTQDKATPQELVSKVREAAGTLSKTGEPGLADFNKKPGPWVWKDSYIFVLDCTKGVMAAHPVKAELIGKPVTSLKDVKGNPAFELLCAATTSPSGTWAEYWIPKPGEKEGSRKISYGFMAAGTPYVVGAGMFDADTTVADLTKNTPR